MLMLSCAANINLHMVMQGAVPSNSSFYMACSALAAIHLYILILLASLMKKASSLDETAIKDRVGSAYSLMNVKRLPKPTILLLSSMHVRNQGLTFAITYGNTNLLFQIFFLNFSSLLILAIMGIARPHETRETLWLEMANEFTVRILLLNLLMCQTNFVTDLSVRSTMAWVFIAIIILVVAVN